MEVLFLVALLFISLSFVLYLYTVLWLRPQRILHVLKKQGIDGPRPRFLSGNLSEMRRMTLEAKNNGGDDHPMNQDYAKTLFPYMYQWRKTYGQTFVFFVGRRASVYVSQTDIVREMSLRVSTDLGKATHLRKIQKPLFGGGILKSNGSEWARQRKTIAPEFYMDKVKGMMELMVKSAIPLLKSWEEIIEREGGTADIDIGNDLQDFSADVISRACFGGSYSKGKEIFEKIRALSQFISTQRKLFDIAYISFLPTKSNREVQRLEGEIRSLILHVVRERMEESTWEDDLLRSILENADINHVGSDSDVDSFIVDNCKNIYFAGHETTAVAATWCLMLLSFYPEWQDRARAEVMELCRGQPPNANMIHNMKTLTMVLQETLRLYPPSPLVVRETFRDMRFGRFHFPKGIDLWIPTSTMHHDPALWGSDADEFKPDRFARGVSGACRHPNAYLPFGFGARTCLGQNFAMVELKVVLSLLLSRFAFSPSPKYRHSPAFRLIIAPEFGMQLTVKNLSQ